MNAQPLDLAVADADAALDGWLRAAQDGDAEAFARLVRAHQARIFGLALRLCAQRQDAEELAQDAFVQLHAALAQMASASHLRHWLLRTVTHRCIDRLRKSRRHRWLRMADNVDRLAAEPMAPESGGDPLAQRMLRAQIQRLPEDARAVLLLRFQEDLDPKEIAAVLAMPHNTVKSHLRRSIDWLRTQQPGGIT
jgi:RNA polymerase sigma-70 factor, ECF subfamily